MPGGTEGACDGPVVVFLNRITLAKAATNYVAARAKMLSTAFTLTVSDY